jgi:hypothetical protein
MGDDAGFHQQVGCTRWVTGYLSLSYQNAHGAQR